MGMRSSYLAEAFITRNFILYSTGTPYYYIEAVTTNTRTGLHFHVQFLLVITPCVLFFLSCVPLVSGEYSERTVMSEYREMKLSDKRLAIRISPEDIMIHNLRDVTFYMGMGMPNDKYWAFFTEHFPKYVNQYSTLVDVWIPEMSSRADFESRSLALQSNALLLIDLPRDGRTLMTGGQVPDFILFIKEFRIFRRERDHGRPVLRPDIPDEPDDVPGNRRPRTTRDPEKEQLPKYDIGHTGVRFPKVIHQLIYTIWDNTEGRIVSYGELSVGRGGNEHSPWELNLQMIAKKIMERSPFKN